MKVGDKIYYVSKERGQPYSALKETVIEKVDIKYLKALVNHREISKDTMMDADRSDPHNLYFLTKDDYYDYFERQKLVAEVKSNLGEIRWGRVDKKDIEQVIRTLSKYSI